MPLQEFWNDDPDLLWVYRNLYIEKEKQRFKNEQEKLNFQCWLQGYYNRMAIASVFVKEVKYMTQPIELNPKIRTKKEKDMEIAQKIKDNIKRGKILLERQRSENKG